MRSLRLLAALLRLRLKKYPTRLEDDMAEISSIPSPPRWRLNCLRVLRDEKQPLAMAYGIIQRIVKEVEDGRAGKGW